MRVGQAESHLILFLSCLLLTCNSLPLALPRTCICFCTLASNRQSFTVTKTTITGDIKQSLDRHLHLRTKLTFNFELIGDNGPDGIQLIIIPLIYFLTEVYSSLIKNVTGSGITDAKDVSESNFSSFILRQIYTCNTSPTRLLIFTLN